MCVGTNSSYELDVFEIFLGKIVRVYVRDWQGEGV